MGNVADVRREMTKTKEQLEEEKKIYSDYNDTKKRLEYKYVLLTCQQLYVCFLIKPR